MSEIHCKTEDEVKEIISELQNENPNLTRDEILKAIASSCVVSNVNEDPLTFVECVKERIRMLKIYK